MVKFTKSVLLGGVAVLAATATGAVAQTANGLLTVSVTVGTTCSTSASTSLSFGTIEPTSAGNKDAQANFSVNCTTGVPYNVGFGPGNGAGATVAVRKLTLSGNTINYSLYTTAARTTVWGNTIGTDTVTGTGTGANQTLTVYGRIPGSQAAVPQGGYSDTVNVTVTY